jgi:hypothetical protein
VGRICITDRHYENAVDPQDRSNLVFGGLRLWYYVVNYGASRSTHGGLVNAQVDFDGDGGWIYLCACFLRYMLGDQPS